MTSLPSQMNLESGSVLHVNEYHAALDLKVVRDDNDDNEHSDDDDQQEENDNEGGGWTALSPAVLNGGMHSLPSSGSHILNSKVPADYDGVNPEPVGLCRQLAEKEGYGANATIGLLTAASMQTLRVSSRSADGVIVDVVVTAGISNSREAGADADYFVLREEEKDDAAADGDKQQQPSSPVPPPGTINTVVVTNATLTPGALAESYAIAIEAKCAACADLEVACAKSGNLAQGTGTDSTVVVSYNGRKKKKGQQQRRRLVVSHAGKHTLFAEMVGQAVREATTEAIMTNIRHQHGNYYASYLVHRYAQRLTRALRGARPCVPPKPMMPVPWAPPSVVFLGVVSVLAAFALPLSHRARVVLAVVAWDRYLGEPPIVVHPVCIVGNAISWILRRTPPRVFSNPVLGFLGGILILFSVVSCSLGLFAAVLHLTQTTAAYIIDAVAVVEAPSEENKAFFWVVVVQTLCRFFVWLVEVLLVKSATSLQLLTTLALQMAKYLERNQISDARVQLTWLCSRDPSSLNGPDLAGGTLESLSENLSDGFVAPLMWYVGGGPLGAMAYRVVNTLDSRIGYRGKYEWFGKPSARLDDVLNLVPARVTALVLALAAAAVPGCDGRRGIGVAWKDRNQCDSPNAGWPMATMAGLLGVRLEKKGQYSLGDDGSSSTPLPGPAKIRLGHHVAQLAGWMIAAVAVVLCSYPNHSHECRL